MSSLALLVAVLLVLVVVLVVVLLVDLAHRCPEAASPMLVGLGGMSHRGRRRPMTPASRWATLSRRRNCPRGRGLARRAVLLAAVAVRHFPDGQAGAGPGLLPQLPGPLVTSDRERTGRPG